MTSPFRLPAACVQWNNYISDLHVLVALAPLGLMACFTRLSDGSLFLILYGLTAVYFSGVMVSRRHEDHAPWLPCPAKSASMHARAQGNRGLCRTEGLLYITSMDVARLHAAGWVLAGGACRSVSCWCWRLRWHAWRQWACRICCSPCAAPSSEALSACGPACLPASVGCVGRRLEAIKAAIT